MGCFLDLVQVGAFCLYKTMNRLRVRLASVGRLAASCVALGMFSGVASASESEGFRLSGFGTLGYVQDDRRDIAPARDISQRLDHSYRTGPSWKMDSRLGVQLEYRFGSVADFVVQSVVRDQEKASVDSSIELAYLSLKPNAQTDVRLGRVGYDAFLMSDHRNVGYAYQWVRPPTEFYGWIPIFSVDGLDAAYRFDAGDVRWRIKVQAGSSRLNIPIGDSTFKFTTHDLRNISGAGQSGPWRFKAAYSEITVDNDVGSLAPLRSGLGQLAAATQGAFPAISAEAIDLGRKTTFKGMKISYATVGAAYDDDLWFAQGELGRTTSSASVGGQSNMAYVGGGRRFGDWAPFVLLSTIQPTEKRLEARSDWGQIGQQNLQNQALYTANSTRMAQSTVSLGARWDFYKQAALKLQWDSTWVQAHGYSLWWRDYPVNDRSQRINMITATLDFIF